MPKKHVRRQFIYYVGLYAVGLLVINFCDLVALVVLWHNDLFGAVAVVLTFGGIGVGIWLLTRYISGFTV